MNLFKRPEQFEISKQPELSERRKKITRTLLLPAIGLLSYCGFLITNIPADKLWSQLSAGQRSVQLTGITGTVWSGVAESVTIRVSGNTLVLPSVRWSLKVAPFLMGKLKVDWDLGSATSDIEGQGTFTLSNQAMRLENVTLDTTPDWLVSAIGYPVPGDLSGNIVVQLDTLDLSNNGCDEGQGNIAITNSQLTSPFGQFDFGNSVAKLSCQDQKLMATVEQKSTLFISEGAFQVELSGRYSFTGKMTPDISMPNAMKKGLGFMGMGRPDSQGSYSLNFRGSVRLPTFRSAA